MKEQWRQLKKLSDAFYFAFFWHLGLLIGGVPIDIRPLLLLNPKSNA